MGTGVTDATTNVSVTLLYNLAGEWANYQAAGATAAIGVTWMTNAGQIRGMVSGWAVGRPELAPGQKQITVSGVRDGMKSALDGAGAEYSEPLVMDFVVARLRVFVPAGQVFLDVQRVAGSPMQCLVHQPIP